MFTIIYEHKILTGLISFFLLSSMICQIISGIIYQKMISESENMSATENGSICGQVSSKNPCSGNPS